MYNIILRTWFRCLVGSLPRLRRLRLASKQFLTIASTQKHVHINILLFKSYESLKHIKVFLIHVLINKSLCSLKIVTI